MLTDKWLKSRLNKTSDKPYEVADQSGFGVRVSAKGKIAFQYRYRFRGKAKRPTIGKYPAISLREARDKWIELRYELERGGDPALLLRSGAAGDDESLRHWFEQWYEKDCLKKKKNADQIWQSFELHIMPVLGDYPINSASVNDWIKVLEDVAANTPSIADRLLTNAKQCYKWLRRRKVVHENPLYEITAWGDLGVKKQNSYHSLDDDEFRLVIEAIELSRMSLRNKLFTKIYTIYGCRPYELKLSEPAHFDFDKRVWLVPAENHKMGHKTHKPLLRPITDVTERLIKEAMLLSENDQYVFTGLNGVGHMSPNASVQWPYNLMQWVRKNRDINMVHWSFYDIRKTARSNWSELTAPHVAEIMLGHKLPGDWQTYDQHHYLAEQTEALLAWQSRLVDLGMRL